VKGSFHASTADELWFEDGKVFSALDRSRGVLSVAPPAAFGFLGARPAGIDVNRSVLKVRKGEALSLVGGDLEVAGNSAGPAHDGLGGKPGTVRAPGGRIDLAALSGPGVVLVGTGAATGAVTGTVRLTGKTAVTSSGDGGGTIRIRGGRLVVEDRSHVFADNLGGSDATGGVAIEAGEVSVTGTSLVTADSIGTGNAGRSTVVARAIELRDGGAIGSSTFGAGNGGEVTVTTDRLAIVGGPGSSSATGIFSHAGVGSTGDAGRVTVEADVVELRDGGAIGSDIFGTGATAPIAVFAGMLTLEGGGTLRSATIDGEAGPISISAGKLLIDGGQLPERTGIFSYAGRHDNAALAVGITITADDLEIRDRGQIVSFAGVQGDAGPVMVTADRQLVIDGGGFQQFPGNTYFTGIGSSTDLWTDAADVTVKTDNVELHDGGGIGSISNSSASWAGAAGLVTIDADNMIIDGEINPSTGALFEPSLIISRSSYGPAEGVTINSNTLKLQNKGWIITESGRDSSNIEINARRLSISNSLVSSDAFSGAISISADDPQIRDGGYVESVTFSRSSQSEINIKAKRLIIDGGRDGERTGINAGSSASTVA